MIDQRILKPESYRAKQMQTLAEWIWAGESGSVVGLAGCGRSNLLSFLSDRPEVLSSLRQGTADFPSDASVALISIDLNDLPANDSSTLYRVILRSFYWVSERFEQSLAEQISSLYLENQATQDPFLSQSALYEMLRAFRAKKTRVVLVHNRFDRFCEQATPQMLNTLRGLRDRFKETLCFIVGMRQQVPYLPDKEALGDMYELLDSHICWVGGMSDSDARYVLTKATRTAKRELTESEVEKMLLLAGNFPVLIKAIGNWWSRTQMTISEISEWPSPSALAAEHQFEFRLGRLWKGLTEEEQFALSAVQTWQEEKAKACLGPESAWLGGGKKKKSLNKKLKKLNSDHAAVLTRLVDKGVCEQGGIEWQIRGDLLAAYVKDVGPYSRGRIRLDQKTEEIYQGLTRLEKLPHKEDTLLRFLIQRPYKQHTYSALAHAIWPDEQLVPRAKEDLFPLISSLRKRIEVIPSDPRYIINWPGRGYQFYPEGRPQ